MIHEKMINFTNQIRDLVINNKNIYPVMILSTHLSRDNIILKNSLKVIRVLV